MYYNIPDDEDRDGPRNVGFFYISDVADRPRRFYRILSPRKLQIVIFPEAVYSLFSSSRNSYYGSRGTSRLRVNTHRTLK
jgi:hypothetical protein